MPEETDTAAGPEGPEPQEAVAAAAAPAHAPVATPLSPFPPLPSRLRRASTRGGDRRRTRLSGDGNLPAFEEEATAEEATAEAAMTDAMVDGAIPGLQGTPLEPGTVDGLG